MSKVIRKTKNTYIEQVHADNFNQFAICDTITGRVLTRVFFQNGSPNPITGFNGCAMEDVIALCQVRLKHFQTTDKACAQNEIAISALGAALHALDNRTACKEKNSESINVGFDREYVNLWTSSTKGNQDV